MHGRRWQQYWQSNFIVQLVPDSPVPERRSDGQLSLRREDPNEDLPDFFNLL